MASDDVARLRDHHIERRAVVAREISDALGSLDERTTFTSFVRQVTLPRSEARALADGEVDLSYRDLFNRVDSAAAALARRGIAAGDAVAILIDNSARYVVWYLAILQSGAVAVPINNKLVEREITHILADSAARLMISDGAYDRLIDAVVAQGTHEIARIPAMLADVQAAGEPPAGACSAHRGSLVDTAAAIYYTSGTTGKPKGVVHTHRTLIAGSLQAPEAWGMSFDDPVALAVTPMFHIASHTLFLPILLQAGTLLVTNFRADEVLRLLEAERVTSFFGVPSILLILAQRARELGVAFPGVKVVQFGAAPMPMDKLGEVQALFPNAALIHGMGQTESCGTLVTLPGDLAVLKIGSVGFAIPAAEVAIVDADDRPVMAGVVGELVGRSPSVMTEYLGNRTATTETLKGGWLHTGDLGYIDPDGFVFLVDRKKDMIIRGGENIYSNEVEQVLASHPALSEVAVVGGPDPIMGERVCAFLVAKPDVGPPDADVIKEHCRGRLAPYKVPVTIQYLDALPRNATGKILKPVLRQMVLDRG